jgi:hypothetical protein
LDGVMTSIADGSCCRWKLLQMDVAADGSCCRWKLYERVVVTRRSRLKSERRMEVVRDRSCKR